jgi:hypothetical protein
MIPDIQHAIDTILGSAAILRHANGAGRIFELFVMTGIAAELQGRGHDVWLQRSDETRMVPGDPTLNFIQRGGAPAGVAPASAGPRNPSCIGFQKSGSGHVWEIWNGVQFKGRSGAAHEFDISIVPQQIGRALRGAGGMPFGRPRAAVECKDVGSTGSLDEVRALIARLYDITVLDGHQPHLGFPAPLQAIYPGDLSGYAFHRAQKTYWAENQRTFNVCARQTGFAKGTAKMTAYYRIKSYGSITAGSLQADTLFEEVADWIDTTLL